MKTISATLARRRWADLLGHVFHTANRVVIFRSGRPIAALVHPDDCALLDRLTDEADIDEARNAIEEAKGTSHVSWSDLKKVLQR